MRTAAEHITAAEHWADLADGLSGSDEDVQVLQAFGQMATAHALIARAIQEEESEAVTIATWQGPLPDEPPQWMVDLGYTRPDEP